MDTEALHSTRLLTFEQNCSHVACTDPSPFALNSACKSKSTGIAAISQTRSLRLTKVDELHRVARLESAGGRIF